jgi:hypothetical protein
MGLQTCHVAIPGDMMALDRTGKDMPAAKPSWQPERPLHVTG